MNIIAYIISRIRKMFSGEDDILYLRKELYRLTRLSIARDNHNIMILVRLLMKYQVRTIAGLKDEQVEPFYNEYRKELENERVY